MFSGIISRLNVIMLQRSDLVFTWKEFESALR